MNRFDLRQLAEDRIADAAVLLAAGRWSGAYYLAGYAVECGLKACIAKLTNQDDFPRERKFVEESYTHNLEKLLKAAGLKQALERGCDGNPSLRGKLGSYHRMARVQPLRAEDASGGANALRCHFE